MISQTVEYALRAMNCLAGRGDHAATADVLAAATGAPRGYLSKILRDLVCANLVRSFRGPRGGFTLARPADDITLLDIVNAVDPIARIRHCPLGNPRHTTLCSLHRCIDDALKDLEQTLERTTLGAILDGDRTIESCAARLSPPAHPDSQPGEMHT